MASSKRGEQAHAVLQDSMKNLMKTMQEANAAFEVSPPKTSLLKPLNEDKGLSFDGGSSFDLPNTATPKNASLDIKRRHSQSFEVEDSGSESDGSSDNDVAAGRFVDVVEQDEYKKAERPPNAEELMAMHKVVIDTPDYFNQKSQFEAEIDELQSLQERTKLRVGSVRNLKPKSPPKTPTQSPPRDASPSSRSVSPAAKSPPRAAASPPRSPLPLPKTASKASVKPAGALKASAVSLSSKPHSPMPGRPAK
mmetsp:Transcript_1470/g.3519  ORF Transcript_1470/g.3519 Transcript_1470/m.3519 type:complete len:251 (+) Transcript_1470:147-899(+)